MGKIKELLRQQREDYIEILKRYTATIAAGIVTCILYVILDVADVRWTDAVTYTFTFLCVTALGFLFTETIVKGRELNRLLPVFYMLSVADGVIWTVLVAAFSDTENEKVSYYLASFFGLYLLVLFGWIFLVLVKDSGLTFERYTIRLLFTAIKMGAVLLILNLGFLLVIELIDTLLVNLDTWSWMKNIEVLLTGFLYLPFGLICLTGRTEEKSRFVRGLILYVMMPLVMAAVVIIYLYVAKILVQGKLPSNEVFGICAGLFCGGVCVWTFAYAYTRDAEDNFYNKCVRYMKYIYAPLVILEAVCLFLRISDYGYTVDRCMGIWFMIAQVIYIAWEPIVNLLRKVFKKEPISFGEHYEWLIYAAIAIYVLAVLIPPFQAEYVEYRSQKKNFLQAYSAENDASLKAAESSFACLNRNIYGEAFLKKNYDYEALVSEMNSVKPYGDYYDWIYVYAGGYNNHDVIDVAGFNTLQEISFDGDYDISYTWEELSSLKITAGDVTETVDLSRILREKAEEKNKNGRNSDEAVTIQTVTGNRLMITYLNYNYDLSRDVAKYLNFKAYLLRK